MRHLMIRSVLPVLLLGLANGAAAQDADHSVGKDDTRNQVMLKTAQGGEKYYYTAEVKSIDFEDYKITVRHEGGDDVYLNNVEDIVFLKAVNPVVAKADLIGTWNWEGRAVTFTEKEISYSEYGEELYRVPYTLDDGVVTYTRPATEWAAEETFSKRVKLLYDKSVMVMKYSVADEALVESGIVEQGDCFIKEGADPETPVGDIMGEWFWYYGDGTKDVRAGLTLDEDNFEFIVTAWSVRYVGTYSYKGGILTMTITEVYSGRSETGEGDGPGAIDPTTLECRHWYLLKDEDIQRLGYDNIPLSFPFISDGSEAYSSFANLPAVYYKQEKDDVSFDDEPGWGGDGDPELNPPD